MSSYSRVHNFTAKDALATGDPAKLTKGSEVDAELNAIQTAVNSKPEDSVVAHLAGAETLTGAKTFTAAATFSVAPIIRIDDATTNASTTGLTVSHTTSGTPANNIGVGVNFEVETAAGNNEVGASIAVVATDTTAGSEDFEILFKTMVAGVAAAQAGKIGQGLVMGAPTGGDKGTGTANVTEYYRDGTAFGGLPGLVKLNSGTVSNAATLDIVMTSYTAFKNKVLVLTSFIPATDGVSLNGRTSTDGGTNYDSAANAYGYAFRTLDSTAVTGDSAAAATEILFTTAFVGNGANEGVDAIIYMFDTTNAATWTRGRQEVVYTDSSATPRLSGNMGAWARATAADVDAFRVYFSSGNIASGTWVLYGYK